MACPLMTKTPIKGDEPTTVPSYLVGRWQEIKENDKEASIYELSIPKTSVKGELLIVEHLGNNNGKNSFKGVLSTINKQLFISVLELSAKTEYAHFAVEHGDNGDLILTPLREGIVNADISGDELGVYLQQHAAKQDYLDREDIARFKKLN